MKPTPQRSAQEAMEKRALVVFNQICAMANLPYPKGDLSLQVAKFAQKEIRRFARDIAAEVAKYRSSHISTIYSGEAIEAIRKDILSFAKRYTGGK